MQRFFYNILSSLPSMAFAALVGLGGIAASLWPEKIKDWLSWIAAPEQIPIWGGIAVIGAIVYPLLLFFLKPKAESVTPNQITHGDGSPILSGVFNEPVIFTTSATARDVNPAPLNFWAMVSFGEYAEGELVGGIEWKKGYSYTILKIGNDTDETYSDLNVIIAPDKPIIAAKCKSDLAECRIGIIGVALPTQQFYVQPDGTRKAYSEEPHPDDILLGPPYRLYCPQLPGRSEIRIDLATVQPTNDVMGPIWFAERHDPTFMDVNSSYKAYGRNHTDQIRLEFKKAGGRQVD